MCCIRAASGVFIALLCVAYCVSAESLPPTTRLSAYFPQGDAQRGEVQARVCVPCHAAASPAMGAPPIHAPKLRHQRASAIFFALQDYKSGRRDNKIMRAVAASLNDQDMRDLSVYLAADRAAIPKASFTAAHDQAASLCAFCHGETGLGEMDGYPVLAGQQLDYLEQALADYRSGARSDPTMSVLIKKITEKQSRDIAEYYAAYTALESMAAPAPIP